MFHKYKWLIDTAEKFNELNPIIPKETITCEKNIYKFKIGDGITNYNDLPYLNDNKPTCLEEDIEVIGTSAGNYTNGMVLEKGKTMTEIFKAMLQKRIAAIYTAPTISIALSATVLQIGTEVSINIIPTFKKNDGGNITNYELYKNNVLLYTNTTPVTYTDTFVIDSDTTYKAIAYYGDGDIKKDNFGDDSPSGRIMAGNKVATSISKAVVPFYHGVSDTIPTTLDGMIKDVTIKQNKLYSYTGINIYACILYTSTYNDLISIIDPNGFETIGGFSREIVVIDGISYKLYYTNDKATIENFEYSFKF